MTDLTAASPLDALVERLEQQESLDLEFKAARGGLPKDLWSTVSAFANTRGGHIVLGVSESGDTVSIDGVRSPDQMLKTLHDSFRNPEKVSHPVCGPDDATIERLGDRQVIVVRVRAVARNARPVFINNNLYVGTYVRRHSGDYRCTRDEVNRMIREASDVANDATMLSGYGLTDVDPDTLAGYRQRFQTASPANPWNRYNDEQFLRVLGGMDKDRQTSAEGLTVAGLLMFGSIPALRSWRARHLIDYRLQISEQESDTRWDDRIAWNGNVLGAFDAIYPRLTSDLLVPFRLQGPTRLNEGPGHVAMREALVNLLVHADYHERDASLIIRSRDGFLFSNPGSSRVLDIDLLTGRHRSDPRNPVLLQMFRMIGLADEAGTGIPKILTGWRELGFKLPDIEVDTERYEFVLHLRYTHLLSDEDRTWLRTLGDNWLEAEQLALVHARHEGDIDNARLRRLTGQHPVDVSKVLGSLRARGLLQMLGNRRAARYELGPAAIAAIGLLGVGSDSMTESSDHNGGGSEGSCPSSEATAAGSEGNEPGSEGGTAAAWHELEVIAENVRGQPRIDPAERDATIIALCTRTPLTLTQLSALLGRRPDYVRQVLRPLIARHQLAYLYPDQPTHPNQKYTVPRAASAAGKETP